MSAGPGDFLDYFTHTLDAGISLSPSPSNHHGHHTTATAQDDVDRNRDVVPESIVVQQIDREEHDNIRHPSYQRYSSRPQKKL